MSFLFPRPSDPSVRRCPVCDRPLARRMRSCPYCGEALAMRRPFGLPEGTTTIACLLCLFLGVAGYPGGAAPCGRALLVSAGTLLSSPASVLPAALGLLLLFLPAFPPEPGAPSAPVGRRLAREAGWRLLYLAVAVVASLLVSSSVAGGSRTSLGWALGAVAALVAAVPLDGRPFPVYAVAPLLVVASLS